MRRQYENRTNNWIQKFTHIRY